MRAHSHSSARAYVHMPAQMDYLLCARDPTASANSNEPIIVKSFPPLLLPFDSESHTVD